MELILGGYMELFNFDKDAVSVERQTFMAITEYTGLKEDEFFKLTGAERQEWVDACRLALLLVETNSDKLYEGYKSTDMYNADGTFNLGAATSIIRSKRRLLVSIERDGNIDLTDAQFILLGDVETKRLASEVLKEINLETAKELNG